MPKSEYESGIQVGELNVEIKNRNHISKYLIATSVANGTVATGLLLTVTNPTYTGAAILCTGGASVISLCYFAVNDNRRLKLIEIRKNIQESLQNFGEHIDKAKRTYELRDDGELIEVEEKRNLHLNHHK